MARSSRPFCLAALGVLLLAAGLSRWACSPARQVRAPRFRVTVAQEFTLVPGENQLPLQIFVAGRRTRGLIAYLELESPAGKGLRSEARWQVPGGVESRFDLPCRIQESGLHRGSLRLYDLEHGVLVYERRDLRLMVWPRLGFTHDRSYYTTEPVLRFRGRLNRKARAGHSLLVELRGSDGFRERSEKVFRGREVRGEIPIASLLPGAHTLRAWLYGVEGVEDSVSLEFCKYLPGEREVKIDLFSQALLKDGEPFFPIGLYWLHAEMLGEARRRSFNAGDYYYKLQGEEIAELMDTAAREGIGILLELSDFIRRREVPDYQGIEAAVERYRRHPALLAWYLIDEPAETGVPPEYTREIFARIRELDPYHPVYLVNNRPHTYAAHIDASDILGIDVYPIPNYPITRVRDYVQEARWASMGRKPVWLVAQAFGGVEHWPRAPTPAELRNMVYQGLVQGARGVLFYRYCREEERHIQSPALWREVQALAAELKALTPVLVASDREEKIRPVGGGREVEALLKSSREAAYLLVVNCTSESRRVRFRAEDLPAFGPVEPLHRTRRPRRRNGMLELDLAPLGTAVYRLEPPGI